MNENDIIVVDQETGELTVPEHIINAIRQNELAIKEAKRANETFKERLLQAMETYGVKSIKAEGMSVAYIEEHETLRLDTKAVKENYPRVYDECSKLSPVKASVRVTIK